MAFSLGIILENILALGLVCLVAFAPIANRRLLLVLIVACALTFIGLMLTGLWVYPSYWLKYVYGIALLGVSVWRIRKPSKKANKRTWITGLSLIILYPLCTLLLWQGLVGRTTPDIQYVDLVAPLEREAGHCAISAGNTIGLNYHYALAGNPGTRSEIHGVDFIKIRGSGVRTTEEKFWHPKPLRPEEYAIFDEPVFAPCSGTVISSENSRPDLLSGAAYRDFGGSNFVALECKDVAVILAHLKEGSVTVTRGDQVEAGEQIGNIGNSGNTIEPHLHINAQTLTQNEDLYTGSEPIVIRFDGRYMARGDCL